MNTLELVNYATVLDTVREWPIANRLALVQDVLKTLQPTPAHSKRDTLSKALGLLATNEPAPTDKQIEQWLDERRMEKYV